MAPRKVSQNIVGNEPEEPFLSFFPSRQKWHRIHAHVPMTNLNEWKSKASFVSFYVYSHTPIQKYIAPIPRLVEPFFLFTKQFLILREYFLISSFFYQK